MKKSTFMAGIKLARALLPVNRGVCTALNKAFTNKVGYCGEIGNQFAETFAPFESYYEGDNLAYFMEQAEGADVEGDLTDLLGVKIMDYKNPVVISRRLFALEMFEAQALAFELYKEF